jgi:transcriptional regulator of arginine metabolism
MDIGKQSPIIFVLKNLLEQQIFTTQLQLAQAMSNYDFKEISQTRISRLLLKVGTIKVKNVHHKMIYKLPNATFAPTTK